MFGEQSYIDGNQVDFGVTVLAGLGSRHVDDLARPSLNDDVTAAKRQRWRVTSRSASGSSSKAEEYIEDTTRRTRLGKRSRLTLTSS